MYTETGGPNRDLRYYGSTFDAPGALSFPLHLGTLTLVGEGIGSTINDTLHLSVSLADPHGQIGTADYFVSAIGFGFYDTMRRQSVGQVQLDFGVPQARTFDTPFGSYSLTLNVPSSPFSIIVPAASSSVSYQVNGSLTLLGAPRAETLSVVETPEPDSLTFLGVAGSLLCISLCLRKASSAR